MYDAALFLHIVGVFSLVIGLAYSLGGFALATRARTAGDVRRALALAPLAERFIPAAMLLIPLTGLYMAARHGGDGSIAWSNVWLDISLGLFVVMSILGPAVESKRIGALHHAAAEYADDAPLSADLLRGLGDPVLCHVAGFGACQIGAFLWLMTNKPDTVPAIVTVVVAAAVSAVVARGLMAGAAAGREGAEAAERAAEVAPAQVASAQPAPKPAS